MQIHRVTGFLIALLIAASPAFAQEFASHPPMRPLPEAADRAMPGGPAYFVDAQRGDDANDGSEVSPWQSVNHALSQLEPGDTLLLRGGRYYENVELSVSGTADRPITIRSHPGELAIIDAGYRAFYEDPQNAWEPYADGADDEYVSTRTYPELGDPLGRRNVGVTGNFGDSMVPLHPYGGWVVEDVNVNLDFRMDPAANHDEHPKDKEIGIYNGPGVWYNPQTERIHVRLAHTHFRGLEDNNYRGETDPREIPLVIAGRDSALHVNAAEHVRIEDLVFRGARSPAIRITDARDVGFDGIHAYGGSPVFNVTGTHTLRIVNSALRGVSAPWSNRASEKYRGLSSYLFIAGRGNADFEMAYSEFTDCHDGLIIGAIDGLRFYRNVVDNFNDDGLYLTTGYPAGGEIRIHENRISRCLGSFAFAGSGDDQAEAMTYIHNNVIDLRQPINRGYQAYGEYGSDAGLVLTHGSPIFRPMMFYHNTVLLPNAVWRSHYAGGFVRSAHLGDTDRRTFNNIFFHVDGMPGLNFRHGRVGTEAPTEGRFAADGNLHWSYTYGPDHDGDFFTEFHGSDLFKKSQQVHEPGWTAHDVFADPGFERFTPDWREPDDLRLRDASAAIDVAVPLREDWPTPLGADSRTRDIGAVPHGQEPWGVGIRGRYNVFEPVAEGYGLDR